MKADEPMSPKDGDISPINRSISNLEDEIKDDELKASTSASKSTRKTEPAFENLPNFSRVTPAQLAYITFPSEGRYQPVRAVSTVSPTTISAKGSAPPGSQSATAVLGGASERYAGGGGILIMADLRPDEEGEFIEFEQPTPPAPPEPAANGNAVTAVPSGPHIALDENAPEADPPSAFEVSNQ